MKSQPQIFAHYLPQFHRIPENNEWWGQGFTEWTNVASAKPLFPGHNQPQIPRDLGFYDLSNLDVMREQVELAKRFGIDGFNFYFYWFNGRRILEGPLERFLESDIDFKFSLTWANENWSRRWDGSDKEVLIEQVYEKGFEEKIFRDLEPYLKDHRYLRVGDVPAFSIYRAQELPNPESSIATLRSLAGKSRLGGIHISAVQSFGLQSPNEVGADSVIEFPPHGLGGGVLHRKPRGMISGFSGRVMDYRKVASFFIGKATPPYKVFRGIVPGWDNTPRARTRAHLIVNSSPEVFKNWLTYLVASAVDGDSEVIFVNAWNEWAEGAYLEPDLLHGLAYLENVREAKFLGEGGFSKLPETVQSVIHELMPEPDHLVSRLSIFHKLRLEISSENFEALIELYRKHGSLLKVSQLILNRIGMLLKPAATPVIKELIFETQESREPSQSSVAFVIHVHYPDFVDDTIRLIKRAPSESRFFISTSDPLIAERFTSVTGAKVDVRIVPNRGRNFGPLLYEFSSLLLKFDIVFHLHSKKSLHSKDSLGKDWNNVFWDTLVGSKSRIQRIIRLLENNPILGVVYPDVTKFVKRTSFSWHLNRSQGKKQLSEWGFEIPPDPIAFPAGGMAVFRPSALLQLLEREWTYDDFPPELSQVDGTTQHLVERLIGVLPTLNGYQHAIYSREEDSFYRGAFYL